MRMIQAGQRAGLGQLGGNLRLSEDAIRSRNLDRHVTLEFFVAGQQHLAETAAASFAFDQIATDPGN